MGTGSPLNKAKNSFNPYIKHITSDPQKNDEFQKEWRTVKAAVEGKLFNMVISGIEVELCKVSLPSTSEDAEKMIAMIELIKNIIMTESDEQIESLANQATQSIKEKNYELFDYLFGRLECSKTADPSLLFFNEMQQQSTNVIRQHQVICERFNSFLDNSYQSLASHMNIPSKEWEANKEDVSNPGEVTEHIMLLAQQETTANELLRKLNLFFQHLPKDIHSKTQGAFTPTLATLKNIQYFTQTMIKMYAIARILEQVKDSFNPCIEQISHDPKKRDEFQKEWQKIKRAIEERLEKFTISGINTEEFGQLAFPLSSEDIKKIIKMIELIKSITMTESDNQIESLATQSIQSIKQKKREAFGFIFDNMQYIIA